MQNDNQNDSPASDKPLISSPISRSNETSVQSPAVKKAQVMATIPTNFADNFIPDLSPSDEEEVSEVESFILDQEDIDDADPSRFLLSHDTIEGAEVRTVDPETQAKLEALLEAAGIGKLSTPDGKAYADPEVLRRLTSSVSCALDEAAAALTRMRAEQADGATADSNRSLAKACSNGDILTVRQLLDEGRSVNETTEEGESLLSLACSAGYFELAQVLLAMRANVEDRGIKGDCTPLMEAASGGYVDIVKLLLANGADVNAQSSAGNTPLHYAACGGHEEVVKVLLESTANVEEHNENGHTPLMEAASAGHVGVAKILLDAGAGINTHSNEFKESALTLACYKGHLEMVKFLLEAGADQEHKTDEMHTALMEASMDGHVEVARLLLDSGAQVNMPADSFESPLTLAACGGHVELANLLIERGANLEEVNDEGYTPLMEAAREGHEEMVALLLAHGADINAQTEETQETALTLACCGGFLDVAEFLYKAGSDLELGCSTPLMEAAQEGHLELVKYLLKVGANVHAQTQTGDTALTYACENGHTDVAEVLLDHNADIEHESEGGRTPVMKAARAGHFSTVQFLISRGCDLNKQTTTNDHTVLSLASAGGHRAVVDLLLKSGANPNHRLKDGSTMLIEAAKGGHTTVVNLLLDWPGTVNAANSDLQNCSPQPNLDINELPRVPIHGLTNIVPPQDPDHDLTCNTNNLSTIRAAQGVPQVCGQVNLKDFNIQTKNVEQIRQNMQKSLLRSTSGTDTAVTMVTSLEASSHGLIMSECAHTSTTTTTATMPLFLPASNAVNNNDPQKACENIQHQTDGSSVGEPVCSMADNSLSGSSSQVSDVGSDFGAEGERTNQDLSTSSSSSTAFDSEDKMNEMMKASERLEAFISKMMRRAELLHTTSEEQSLQKQQILEELQKVEQELQEKAKNPLLMLNAQSKHDDKTKSAIQGAAQVLQAQIALGGEGSQLAHLTLGADGSQLAQMALSGEAGQLAQLALGMEGGHLAQIALGSEGQLAQIALGPDGGQFARIALGDECGQLAQIALSAEAGQLAQMALGLEGGQLAQMALGIDGSQLAQMALGLEGAQLYQPMGMTLPVQVCSANTIESVEILEGEPSPNPDQCQMHEDRTVISGEEHDSFAHNGAALSFMAENADDVKTPILAKQESFSSASNASSSSADSGCGHSDFNGVGAEGSEVDGPSVLAKGVSGAEPSRLEDQPIYEEAGESGPAEPEPSSQSSSRASSEEVDLSNVLPAMEGKELAEISKELQALHNQEFLQQQVQQQLQAGSALGLQQQLQQQQQQQLLHQHQLTQLAQQCLQSYPVQLEPLLQQPISSVLNTNATTSPNSCREMQLEHQRQQLQKQLELEQAKTKTLQAQLQLQKQIKTPPQTATTKYQELKVQQQTTVTCQQTQLQPAQLPHSDLMQIKLQQQLQQLHQLQLHAQSQLPNQEYTQQELLQQQLQQAAQLQLLHQHHLKKQQQAITPGLVTAESEEGILATHIPQTSTTAQLYSQQDLLQQTQQLQQQLQQVQQLQQLAQQQKHLGQFPSNMWPVTTANTQVSTASNQKKAKKKQHQLLPQQQQQLLQQQLLVNNQLSTQYANYTTASTNTMATGTNTLYDYLEMITPSSSTPMTPNPSPASPQISPPVYPAVDLDAETESNHDTALTLACAGGHAELVSLLLSRGADIEHRDKKGFTPLILAATAGHSEVVEILLDHGADIEAQSERTKDTPLSLACSGGRYEVVELLLTRGANKEHRNVSDYTPLSLAASGGYVNIIKLLLNHGAEINSRTGSKLGISPLMLAAMNGHTAAVKLLLDMGSDINAQIETNKNTALTLACFQGRHEVVSLLVDRRANIEHRAKTGLTPLMEAASGGYVEVGRVLLDKGADVNAPPVPSSRDTALTIAADKGHYRFVDLLLSRTAAIDVKNKKGNSPLWLACNGGHLDVVQLLVQAKADVDSQDNRKVSCLMSAFRKGHVKVIKWLVKHVTQFPSDQECMRYISTVTDQELLKKCHQCMEIIVSAKARQAAEANKNANILLQEIDAERSREESKKAAAARKREKKRKKKKEKQEREREQEEKKQDDPKDGLNSKSSTPEPGTKDADDDDDDDDDDEEEEEEKIQPPVDLKSNKKIYKTDSSSIGVRSSSKEPKNTNTPNVGPATISNSVTRKNNRNQAMAQESSTHNNDMPQLPLKQQLVTEPPRTAPVPTRPVQEAPSSVTVSAASKAKSKRKVRERESKEREKENMGEKNKPTLTESAKQLNVQAKPGTNSGSSSPAALPNNKTVARHHSNHLNKTSAMSPLPTSGSVVSNGNLPNKNVQHNIPKISNTGIGDLDDFGALPPPPTKNTPHKEKEKKTPDKSRVGNIDNYGMTLISPGKANSMKSPGAPSPNKRGGKKEEGWKEVIRKSKKVSVPPSNISRVIGRNGCNINAIREVSGAHIEIDKAKPSGGDRNITIKGSAEATRQAHNLIMALIKDPDKELEQIIPKLKNRVINTNTLTLNTSVWHNSMANGIPPNTAPTTTTVVTTLVNTVTSSVVTGNKGITSKGNAVGKTTGIVSTVTTTVTQSAPNRSNKETKHSTKTSTMSNIGVFQVPIGVWNASMAQSAGNHIPGLAVTAASSPNLSNQARRQLFPGGEKGSRGNNSSAKQPVTYASPSMAKTKTVTVSSPAVASRVDNKPTECRSQTSSQQQHQKAVGVSPSRPMQTSTVPYQPQPLPIKASTVHGAPNKPAGASNQTNTGPASGEYFSPFNNLFNLSERVLGKKEDSQEGKMNFASVAAAGVVSTTAPSLPLNVGSSVPSQPVLHGREMDPGLQAKAPGYKAPGAHRTSSPQVGDQDRSQMAPGYRMPPDGDIPRVPGFKPTHMGNLEYMRMPEDYGLFVMQQKDGGQSVGAGDHPDNLSPRSATSTPGSTQSPKHKHLQSPADMHRDEYSIPDRPMTLPKIQSNLNPNAPDFTFRAQAANNHQLHQQLLAAQIMAQQQIQHQQAMMSGSSSHSNTNSGYMPPASSQRSPFMMSQTGGDAQSNMLGLPDSLHQMGSFGAGSAGYQPMGSSMGSSSMGDSGVSMGSNRQYSPMAPSAVRSESAASSVGTSSKGESSPVLHVSNESSPLSSSAPSPTDHSQQYSDERFQGNLHPIGTGRTNKRERVGHPYVDLGDSTSNENLWGIARELGSADWMVGNPSLGVSASVANGVNLLSRGMQSDMDDNRPSSQPASMPPHPNPSLPPHLIPGLMALDHSSMLDPAAMELAIQQNQVLLAPNSANALFASGVPTIYAQSSMGLPSDGLGGMWNPQVPQGQGNGPHRDPGENDPKAMWNNWTPPPNM